MLLRIYIILLYFRMLPPTSENKEKAAQKVGFFFVQLADFKLFCNEIALVFYFISCFFAKKLLSCTLNAYIIRAAPKLAMPFYSSVLA